MTKHWLLAATVFIGFLAYTNVSFSQANTMHPETVMVTLHVKSGSEAEMQRVLEQHWKTANAMNLVSNTPHLTIRGTEAGDKTYFVDVFTWRDASIPDDAPPEIQKLWDEMNRLVESRGGQPGLASFPCRSFRTKPLFIAAHNAAGVHEVFRNFRIELHPS